MILLTFSSIFPYFSLSSLMLIIAVLKSLSVCLLQYLDPLGSASISYSVCSWSNTFPAPLSNDFWSCANICGWNIVDAPIFVCLLCFFLRGTVDFLLSSVRLPTDRLDPPSLVSGFITVSLFQFCLYPEGMVLRFAYGVVLNSRAIVCFEVVFSGFSTPGKCLLISLWDWFSAQLSAFQHPFAATSSGILPTLVQLLS